MGRRISEAARRFGAQLRHYRRERELTQARLGRLIGVNHNHVSNLERGERNPTPGLLAALDEALGTGDQLGRLWEALRDSKGAAWLSAVSDLQADAKSILQAQPLTIPGLLQTEDYARGLIRAISYWESESVIEGAVEARMARARRFLEGGRPLFVAVISESVVRQRISSPDVMRDQLDHLLALAEIGRVSMQVITRSEHPGLIGPFMVVAPSVGPEVVYEESASRGQIIDDGDSVTEYKLRFGRLQALALDPDRTMELIREERKALND